jgi:methylated-DNA-[protein]-cysteine S-methyltransferase
MARFHRTYASPLGPLQVVAEAGDEAEVVRGMWFDGQKHHPGVEALGREVEVGTSVVLDEAIAQLEAYFAGDRTTFDLPLAPIGEDFQQRVWARLLEIPHGETTTYGAIAVEFGDRNLAQAVGGAVGHNPISIVIPCHRVLGANGSLTGYAGGLDRKRALLDLEEPAESRAARLF